MSDLIPVTRRCLSCNKELTIQVSAAGLHKWRTSGCLIQEALPELGANDRELLISGICGPCFNKTFMEPVDPLPEDLVP